MKELIRGIIRYRAESLPAQRATFAKLADGQQPHALMIACSDSRVVPTLFTTTGPGDLFTVRNAGNLVPPCEPGGRSANDESAWAAIEYSLMHLPVWDIIVCGHSECGAMRAALDQHELADAPHLRTWLRHCRDSLERQGRPPRFNKDLQPHNELSQINVLQQLRHLTTYPLAARKAGGQRPALAWLVVRYRQRRNLRLRGGAATVRAHGRWLGPSHAGRPGQMMRGGHPGFVVEKNRCGIEPCGQEGKRMWLANSGRMRG